MSSDESDIEERLVNLKLDNNDKYINILLLGETGVGKSTLINALANYFSLKYFKNAEDDGIAVVIPTTYDITDKKNKSRKIQLGMNIEGNNENLVVGESATQEVRTYVFPLWKGRINVRLIDTPGMGDTRGIDRDEKNCENIIDYLKTLEKIHAICFLLKPTQARETIFFKYCLHQMLSRFDKTACENIFFLFTSTRGSDFTPGDTLRILEKIVQAIQENSEDIKISTDKNYYCFDNEAFKYLGAAEKKVKFDDALRETNLNSWRVSAKNAHSLITRLQRGCPTPYSTDRLMVINFAQRMLFFFSKLLATISQIIEDNLNVLNRLKARRNDDINEIEKLKQTKKKTHDVEKTKVGQPITVCTSQKCADAFWVDGKPKWHYKKVCHGTCIEVSNVRMEIIGCPELLNCQAISQTTRKCSQCGCDYSIHMHVDYITRVKESYVLDDKILNIIVEKESVLDSSVEIIDDISLKNVELQSEYESIQTIAGGIASFLKKNAIVSFSSPVKEYIIYLINQKQSLGDSSENKSAIDALKNLQKQFEETDKIFQEALKNPKKAVVNDMQEIEEQIKVILPALKQSAEKIKWFFDLEKISQKSRPSSSVTEYVHPHYYEGDDDVKKGARNKNRSEQWTGGKQGTDDRDRKYQDRRANEERNKKEWESRNRNDRQSNRDQNEHQQRRRSAAQYSSTQNNPPPLMSLGAYGGNSHPQNRDHRYPPGDHASSKETYKVTVNVAHPTETHPPSHYPASAPYAYSPYNAPHAAYPQPGQPPYHPYQNQSPHSYQGQPPYYPPRAHPPHYHHQSTPYQRPAPVAQPARNANYEYRNQQPQPNDRRYNQGQRGDQYGRGGPEKRGNYNRRERSGQRVPRSRYRRNDSNRKENTSGDESDESVASSKR